MPKKPTQHQVPPSLKPSQAIPAILSQIERAKAMRQKADLSNAEYEAWRNTLHGIVRQAFGDPNETLSGIISAGNCFGGIVGRQSPLQAVSERHKNLDSLVVYLTEACTQLDSTPPPSATEQHQGTQNTGDAATGKKEFIIHGHDDGARESVARFLTQLDLSPIILHEQANGGNTVIEKFEAHANVAFAVVLLTPDDVGAAKDQSPGGLRPRARQNVILELGYFVKGLGRKNVCVLHKGDLELPSDISGVLYVPMDSHDGWKTKLAKEMRHAGLNVDMNKI